MIVAAGSSDAAGTALADITIVAGESVSESVAISSGGLPLDITGSTFKMTVAFATPLVLTTANSGVTTTDAAGGVCRIDIADTASGAFAAGAYAYDFWMINGTTATRLFAGTFNVLGSVSSIP